MAMHLDDIGRQLEAVAKIPGIPPILKLLRDQTGMRFVGIARVTPDRWITCAALDEGGYGLVPGDELDVHTTICKAQLNLPKTIVFDDAEADPVYRSHPAPQLYGFRSHMSSAIHLQDGSYFGSLCVLDPDPVVVTNERNIGMLEGMAALIGRLLDQSFAHGATLQALNEEKAAGISREQFLAVVAHDLRNPLSTMHVASEILSRSPDLAMGRIGKRLRSSAARMTGLVNDLVDFSRGRAGSAMPIRMSRCDDLDSLLEHVVQEVRDIHPQRHIRSDIHMGDTVRCDPARLQQLVSNLLANAVNYGAADSRIVVQAGVDGGQASVAVTNWGNTIAPERLNGIFAAYTRDSALCEDTSLGLGLHICQLIATAHHGELSVTSDADTGTRFEMRWPSGQLR